LPQPDASQWLLYADDMALLADSRTQLQHQLDVLHQWAQLVWNGGLCEQDRDCDIRNSAFTRPAATSQYNGAPVQISSEFRYLGIIFHETQGVIAAIDSLTTVVRRAIWGLVSRFRVARITDISLKLQMFTSLVLPIMEYCGEVWGPGLLSRASSTQDLWDNPLQKV
jgi:hypothetical protein